jgi:mannose-6-phosphate isomerase-like protein (cupin superfamily)
MKIAVLAAAMLAAVPLMAADGDVVVWSAAELKAFGPKLAPRMNEHKVATERLVSWGNHFSMVAHREADGEAEVHDKQADVFFVQSGTATLVYGGETPGAKTTAPGELRAASITGGQKKTLGAGDVVHIPAKVPHQLLVPAGKEFTYFVIKVDTP